MTLRPLAALALLAASPAAPNLQPGLWEVANRPESATLDGRRLAELPYAPPPPERVCLTPQAAADPAAWLARDAGSDCRFSKRSITGGRVDIAATCPAHDAGHRDGTMHLSGQWTPARYSLRFDTVTDGENGRMGFTGTMTGRRIGDCPAG